ncbi:MAG: hypothetical protein MZW92_71945 [Comamonadaceae bacterium]|nr:hypothetical protein [Comamonadaceae bacterium]
MLKGEIEKAEKTLEEALVNYTRNPVLKWKCLEPSSRREGIAKGAIHLLHIVFEADNTKTSRHSGDGGYSDRSWRNPSRLEGCRSPCEPSRFTMRIMPNASTLLEEVHHQD